MSDDPMPLTWSLCALRHNIAQQIRQIELDESALQKRRAHLQKLDEIAMQIERGIYLDQQQDQGNGGKSSEIAPPAE